MYVLQRPIAYTHLLRPLMRLRAPSQASGILSLSSSQKDGKRKRGGQAHRARGWLWHDQNHGIMYGI